MKIATRNLLADMYTEVRGTTERLCRPLEVEDYVIQSMPDASPVKWHLAHTTWFFEAFILSQTPGYSVFNRRYDYLFNSYYVSLGERHTRAQRGLLSRPTVSEVYEYRAHVDRAMQSLLEQLDPSHRLCQLIELGLHHEQQHQELLITDLKHLFWQNPLRPAYDPSLAPVAPTSATTASWIDFDGGLVSVGHDGQGFAYDNEQPRHQVFLEPFQLASHLVTNSEYFNFIKDDGYARPEFWLSDGWAACEQQGWTCPLYWEYSGGDWMQFTMSGMRPIDPHAPLCHVSYFEADAFAQWEGARLPREEEWELAAADCPIEGSFADARVWQPASSAASDRTLSQMFGEAWQWTSSSYSPYPGFQTLPGALGEYNGKFMCNQFVLRGGSCATPRSHIRPTYRNFFAPHARWQFAGLRLARDVER